MNEQQPATSQPREVFNSSNRDQWKAALDTPRPLLIHLNADTTWLLQIPYPRGAENRYGRSHFNILIDPWLQGPQSDVASWFSTQWHVVEPSVATIAELNKVLGELDGAANQSHTDHSLSKTDPTRDKDEKATASDWFIDAVIISHEFTDHCHQATLEELPKSTPVIAGDEAAKLIKSWNHFDEVITTPPYSSQSASWQKAMADCHPILPKWLGIGRVVTAGNALYYHSAVIIAFGSDTQVEAVLYSPHGINAQDLAFLPQSGLKTLALLHGLHDVRIWMTKQLNLGALNGLQAMRACGAKYWVATHDEVKRGGGLISWMLQRTVYSLKDAVKAEEARIKADADQEDVGSYQFLELGSGGAIVLV
ncbi:hypothetical protein MCOR25_009604 [Pyricularia grisea]|uniref:Metallo-beta-lactamase domain-containing protein n=1 Tax=Pyricularia grisea TaxID=148305 RepID=A0A6P8AR09_PYRGI|nr:uncharacterized protein PgNI_12022 [Pyricularia grisea]KAI6352025.1 hypothetical protein MCOR25_009604 [Pyricularia grisea]TLD04500.1 hypothetical protein PgNI_12022 [Pyricularia grisea]